MLELGTAEADERAVAGIALDDQAGLAQRTPKVGVFVDVATGIANEEHARSVSAGSAPNSSPKALGRRLPAQATSVGPAIRVDGVRSVASSSGSR